MELIKNLDSLLPNSPNCSVTIGNFDGCHLGHQKLLIQAAAAATGDTSLKSVAITFSPNPKQFFGHSTAHEALYTEEQKARALRDLGLDFLIVQSFDDAFCRVTHGEFFQKILQLKPQSLIVGKNFRFGFKRLGDPSYLKKQCHKHNIQLTIADGLYLNGSHISSTKIRRCLKEDGNVNLACMMLGKPYSITGVIVPGKRLGKQLGFPTANLAKINQLIPSHGVYCGHLLLNKNKYPVVTNIGVCPTVNLNSTRTIVVESHIIGQVLPDFYHEKVELDFQYRLRNEKKFSDLPSLKQQIIRDCEKAARLLHT